MIKYVSLHAADLGVDPARIAIAGESGGGYICAGAMVQLARHDEAHLFKLAVPIIPMLTDYCFSDTAAMTKFEREHAPGQQKIWRLIAGPGVRVVVGNSVIDMLDQFEEMSADALLYPGKADAETLRKMPPSIIWKDEFDIYITEATRKDKNIL